MVKGQTKSGIKFNIDERIKDDSRLIHLYMRVYDNTDALESGRALNKLLAMIFGSDDGTFEFMNEVAEKHDGICSPSVMFEELTEILSAIGAKNL